MAVISNSGSFTLDINDIARMRNELSDLIINLSSVYLDVTSKNKVAVSTSSDLVMLGDKFEVSVFASPADHGGRAKHKSKPQSFCRR